MCFSFVETKSSPAQQSAVSAKDGRMTRTKRKASPDKQTPRKRTRVSKSEPPKASEEVLHIKIRKRKVGEDSGEPLRKKKRRCFEDDKELLSTSVNTGRGRLIMWNYWWEVIISLKNTWRFSGFNITQSTEMQWGYWYIDLITEKLSFPTSDI